MQLNITFRNLDATEALKEFAREKLEKVKKYFDRPIEAHVVLSLERHIHHADISIHAGPYAFAGRGKSEDMYHSIDLAMEKIETQLKRAKEKVKNHHDRQFAHHQREALEGLARETDEGEELPSERSVA